MISLKEMNPILLILIGWNAITFLLMGLDKFFAKRQKRRIKESTLLGSAFFLGAAGSLLGMLVFRHKTRKKKFVFFIPVAVIVNVFAFIGLYTMLN